MLQDVLDVAGHIDSSMNATNTLPALNISTVKKNNTVINSSIMFAVGFISNLLALIFLQRSGPEIKRKLFYRLVAGLALTDLIGTSMTSPVVIAVYVNDFKWIGADPMCKYFGFMMIFAGAATMTIVCLMSIERLLCVRKPYLYYTRLRKKHATYFLVGAWIFAAVTASLPLIGFGEIVLQYPYTWCFFDYYTEDSLKRGFNYLFAVLALVMISVTVTCNGIVLYTLFRTKMRGLNRNNNRDSRTFSGYSRRYAEFQMAVLLIGITVVFSTCYSPLMVRIVINQTRLMPRDMKTDLLMIRFASMNQVLDPWVYILLRREVVWTFVRPIKTIFAKLCRNTKKDNRLNTPSRRVPDSPFLGASSDENRTCCMFCYHCLCDPPTADSRRRSSSLYYTESIRYTMYRVSQRNPTQSFARELAENYSNLLSKSSARSLKSINSVESESNKLIHKVRSLPAINHVSETITQQPVPPRDNRVIFLNSYTDDVTDSVGCDSDSY